MSNQLPVIWHEGVKNMEKRSRYGLATLLNETFDNTREFEFVHCSTMSDMVGHHDEAIVVIHGEHEVAQLAQIASDLTLFKRAIVVLYCDETPVFRGKTLVAPNRKIWVQTPLITYHTFANRYLICGYPDDTQMHLSHFDAMSVDRPLDWFFAGQVTHGRRLACVNQLRNMSKGALCETPGFWQGMPRAEYYATMANAKIIPCPSGPATPDTMRMAEAIEAGCVPLVDATCSRKDYPAGYWNFVLQSNPPFPLVEDWSQLPQIMAQELAKWPHNRNKLVQWWKEYKASMCDWLREDIAALRRGQ